MERLDKVVSSQTNYSRSDVKKLVAKKQIMVNNIVIKKADIKVDEINDEIIVCNEVIEKKKKIYLMLNKPKGYVSATIDKKDKTVLDFVPEKYRKRNLFPAGRLDKDTVGMMIITDDGVFAHDILAPKKHVNKIYLVTIDKEITEKMMEEFQKGVLLNDGICKEANLEKVDTHTGIVTLHEGRYHQIKRMFGCFNCKVIELERIGMGKLMMKGLPRGEIKELTEEELQLIKAK